MIQLLQGHFKRSGTKDKLDKRMVHTARRKPLPLVTLVQKELLRLENKGLIEQETQPTERCTALVPLLEPKKGDVRCWVNFRKLNCAVRREKYILPTVEEIRPRLNGSKGFTSSGF